MVDIKREHTFDAPIAKVWKMFSDPASHISKFEAMGHRDVEVVEEKKTKSGLKMVINRTVEVDLPGFAKRVLKPANTVVSTDRWNDNGDGTYGGTFSADTKGAPIKVNGTTLIEADGKNRTHYVVHTTIEVKVPLIGGKLSDFSKGIVNKQMDDEFRLGDQWLAKG
jgi:uncharacterized protein YndB with AHSA1/START domain